MSTEPDNKTPAPKIHAIRGWRFALLWPFGLILKLWGRTLRFELTPEDLANYTKKDEPIALVLWHNRLFLASEIVRRFRKGRHAYALVSASKDGAWLTAFFNIVGMRVVRGSSSRYGREAASALIERLHAGDDIGITPDGPRGPMYDFKAGAVIVARRAKAPMLLIGAEFENAWQMKSWDRFYVPKPFSKIRMRARIIPVAQMHGEESVAESIKKALIEINPD